MKTLVAEGGGGGVVFKWLSHMSPVAVAVAVAPAPGRAGGGQGLVASSGRGNAGFAMEPPWRPCASWCGLKIATRLSQCVSANAIC